MGAIKADDRPQKTEGIFEPKQGCGRGHEIIVASTFSSAFFMHISFILLFSRFLSFFSSILLTIPFTLYRALQTQFHFALKRNRAETELGTCP